MNLCCDTCCSPVEDGSQDFKMCSGLQAADISKQQTSGIVVSLWELFVTAVSLLSVRTDSPSTVKHNREKAADLCIS